MTMQKAASTNYEWFIESNSTQLIAHPREGGENLLSVYFAISDNCSL